MWNQERRRVDSTVLYLLASTEDRVVEIDGFGFEGKRTTQQSKWKVNKAKPSQDHNTSFIFVRRDSRTLNFQAVLSFTR